MTLVRLTDSLVHCAFRAVSRILFRVRIAGAEHIPRQGPALLVSNHLSWFDAFVIGASVPSVVRFVVWEPYYERRLFNWALRLAQAIPVRDTPPSATRAVRLARRHLCSSQVVCIFAEGSISRTGELLPFQRGLEAIVRNLRVPVIPVHLSGLWQGILTDRRTRVSGIGPRLRHPVVVSFGAPMPPTSPAHIVRHQVSKLGARQRP